MSEIYDTLQKTQAARERERYAPRLDDIGKAVDLYRELERALGETADTDISRLVTAAREGEHALANWARHLETFRGFKQRFDAGLYPAELVPNTGLELRAPADEPPQDRAPRRIPFLWEALAFAVGFAVALMFMK